MLLLRTDRLPDGRPWAYELKLDWYRALAIKTAGRVKLRSRNDNDFNARYPVIVQALSALPDETVIDGEVVALDKSGRPSFNMLQNYGSAGTTLVYYLFDLLVLQGRDVTSEPLARRREILTKQVLPSLREPIHESPVLNAGLRDLVAQYALRSWKVWWPNVWTADTNPASDRRRGRRCALIKAKNS